MVKIDEYKHIVNSIILKSIPLGFAINQFDQEKTDKLYDEIVKWLFDNYKIEKR